MKDSSRSIKSFLNSTFGEASEVALLQYLADRAEVEPNFLSKINNSLYQGILSNYEQERKERVEIETLAVSAMGICEKGRVHLKKNNMWRNCIYRKLKFMRYFPVETFEEKFKKREK